MHPRTFATCAGDDLPDMDYFLNEPKHSFIQHTFCKHMFLSLWNSEFPIKKKNLIFNKVSHSLIQCGRWDLNEFPYTANPHRKELSAHQLIKCNHLVNRSFFLTTSCLRFYSTNWNSDKTLFIAFNNCYILSSKSPQTLKNAKFITSEFSLKLSLVLYPFPSYYEPS